MWSPNAIKGSLIFMLRQLKIYYFNHKGRGIKMSTVEDFQKKIDGIRKGEEGDVGDTAAMIIKAGSIFEIFKAVMKNYRNKLNSSSQEDSPSFRDEVAREFRLSCEDAKILFVYYDYLLRTVGDNAVDVIIEDNWDDCF